MWPLAQRTVVYISVAALGVFSVLSLAWGDYINADLFDETLQMYRSGADTPREYYIPPMPSYEKHDPHEFVDYNRTLYSPYAQLQLSRAIQAGTVQLNAGYYLVKLDVVPPPPDPPKPLPQNPVLKRLVQLKRDYFPSQKGTYKPAQTLRKPPEFPPSPNTPPEKQFKGQLSLVIKRMGEKELVIPVDKTDYQEKALKKGKSTSSLKLDSGSPLSPQIVYITYCMRQLCYQSAPILPGLLQ